MAHTVKKLKVKLPTKNYEIVLPGPPKPSVFVIKPLSSDVKSLLDDIVTLGGSISLMSDEDEPTSIFVDYKCPMRGQEMYGYQVGGVEMSLHLSLLGSHDKFYDKLKSFKKDIERVKNEELPEEHKKSNHRLVRVIKTYEY